MLGRYLGFDAKNFEIIITKFKKMKTLVWYYCQNSKMMKNKTLLKYAQLTFPVPQILEDMVSDSKVQLMESLPTA